jgi:hypothetical protein
MALANVNLKFGLNLKDFDSKLSQVNKSLDKAGKKMVSIGKGLSLGLTLPIIAMGVASVKAASDAEETFSKFDTVFRDVKGSAEEAFKTLRNEYGLSSTASKQLLGDTGDLLTGFGFSQESALGLSTEVQKLAVDLASFTNFSGGAEGASQALTKALLGERDSLKALGIAILEDDVKKQMAINSAKGLTFETERQAKAQATLDLAIQQSGNAIGDYARTQDSFANQSRLMRSRLEDIAVELGQVFLPLMTKVVTVITSVINWFSGLDDGVKRTIVIVAAIVAAIGPLLVVFGTVLTLIPTMVAGLATLKVAFLAVTGPIGLTIGIIALLTAGIIASKSKLTEFSEELQKIKKEGFDGNFEETKKEIDFLVKKFREINPALTQAEAVKKAVTSVRSSYEGLSSTALKNKKMTAGQLSEILKRIDAYGVSLDSVIVKNEELGETALETYSKIAELRNENVFEKWAEEADAFNASISESQRLISGIQSGSAGILDKQILDEKKSKVQMVDVDLGMSGPPVIEVPEIDDSSKTAFLDSVKGFNDQASQILSGGVMSAFAGLGEALGSSLASGAPVLQALGSTLLSAIGSIATELGKAAIGIGVGMIAVKLAFKNPATAIAAGVALVAIGAFISSKVSKMTQGGGGGGGGPLGPASSVDGARAMGGSVQYNKPYLVGERGPEIFTPSGYGSITPNSQMGGGMQEIRVVVEGRISGQDIFLSGERYTKTRGRTT